MNLFEYENSIFGDVWNEKTIKELHEYEPPKGTGTPIGSEPNQYISLDGRYIAEQLLW